MVDIVNVLSYRTQEIKKLLDFCAEMKSLLHFMHFFTHLLLVNDKIVRKLISLTILIMRISKVYKPSLLIFFHARSNNLHDSQCFYRISRLSRGSYDVLCEKRRSENTSDIS